MPLLVVITALAVFQAVGPPGAGTDPTVPGPESPQSPQAPVATEAPPGQTYKPEVFSAVLPDGGAIPEAGARTYEVLPGNSPKIGPGNDLYTYTVEAEVGVQLAEGNNSFSHLVQDTLSDPRSWTNPLAGQLSLQRVDGPAANPNFRVTLLSQQTAREVCGFGNGLPFDVSCRITKGNEDRVYINAARWVRGAVAFDGDYGSYRRYAINHEVGHALGNGHAPCGAQGGLAPVMMQQTFSTSNNELHELNKANPQGAEIPANGFTCKYNPWPFPTAGGGPGLEKPPG